MFGSSVGILEIFLWYRQWCLNLTTVFHLKSGACGELESEVNPFVSVFLLLANIDLGTRIYLGKNKNLLTYLSTWQIKTSLVLVPLSTLVDSKQRPGKKELFNFGRFTLPNSQWFTTFLNKTQCCWTIHSFAANSKVTRKRNCDNNTQWLKSDISVSQRHWSSFIHVLLICRSEK